MTKIKSLADLQEIKKEVKSNHELTEKSNNQPQVIRVKIGMSTCGIASGAREIMKFMREEFEFQAIDATVTQTGCLGYCYAEPMVEVTLPGEKSKVFGYVDKERAKEIIDKYIVKGEFVEGEINVSFESIYD